MTPTTTGRDDGSKRRESSHCGCRSLFDARRNVFTFWPKFCLQTTHRCSSHLSHLLPSQDMASANLYSERRVARNEFKLAGIRIRQKEEKTKK